MIKYAQKINGLLFSVAFLSIISKLIVFLFSVDYLLILGLLLIAYNICIKIDYSLDSRSFFAFRVLYRFQ